LYYKQTENSRSRYQKVSKIPPTKQNRVVINASSANYHIEHKTQLALSEALLQKIAVAFCNEPESAGYWVGLYSYKSFLESNFTPDLLKRYAVWVAHTGVAKTNFKHPYGIWQYSHTGKINGINTIHSGQILKPPQK